MGTLPAVFETLASRLAHAPIHEIMRQDVVSEGGVVVLPGSVSWMPAEDWAETDVIGRFGKEIRIIAIIARQPGTGAFRRLVAGIEEAGFRPVVVEPFAQMQAILRRWGWRARVVGKGVHRQEQWRPARRAA